jgi:hypothetical protein
MFVHFQQKQTYTMKQLKQHKNYLRSRINLLQGLFS